MRWAPTFVAAWIQFAVAASLLLGIGLLVIRRLAQPAERARLVPLVIAAALAVPPLTLLAPWPTWHLGWIERPAAVQADRQPQSAAMDRVSIPTAPPRSAPPAVVDEPDAGLIGPAIPQTVSAVPATVKTTSWSAWSIAAVALLAVHALAAIVLASRGLIGRWQLERLCRAAQAAPVDVERLWNEITGGRGRSVRVFVSSEVDAPSVFGCFRYRVIVPTRIAMGDAASLRYCLAHEWSHIDRGDLRTWTCVRLCRYVLWYQVAYWKLTRELRLCQEFLADERSAGNEDRLDYSQLLLDLAQYRFGRPATGALSVLDQPSELGRRVRRLIEGTALATRCRRRVTCAALAVALLAAGAFSMVRLESALAEPEPQAQAQPTEPAPAPATSPALAEQPAAPREVQPAVGAQPPANQTAEQPKAPAALHFTGRVLDKLTTKPIVGAKTVVRRETHEYNANKIIEESKHTTDAEGKFSFVIPPEQVAIRRLYIELDVEHPDYAAKKGFGYGLSMILKNQELGAPPFFAETELLPAEPITGTVLSPEGRPLAGIKIQGFSRKERNDWENSSFVNTVTDEAGKFRLPLVKDGLGVMWVLPKDFAIVERYLGETRGELGEIRLEPGARSRGRLLDLDGQPVAGAAVNISAEGNQDLSNLSVSTSLSRGAITDAQGNFAFGPLPAGKYVLEVEDYLADPLERDTRRFHTPHVFLRHKVEMKTNPAENEFSVQAVPHVTFEAQYYNSKGEKTNGHDQFISGRLGGEWWHSMGQVQDGHIVIRAPRGLEKAHMQLSTNEHSALRYRLHKDGLLEGARDDIQLGTLNDDLPDFEIIRYVAPIVIVQAVDEDGQPIPDFKASAAYPWGKQRFILKDNVHSDLTFERQPDGRMRSEQMLPDEEVTFTAQAAGFEDASEIVKLAEGEKKDVTIRLQKKPSANSPKP